MPRARPVPPVEEWDEPTFPDGARAQPDRTRAAASLGARSEPEPTEDAWLDRHSASNINVRRQEIRDPAGEFQVAGGSEKVRTSGAERGLT